MKISFAPVLLCLAFASTNARAATNTPPAPPETAPPPIVAPVAEVQLEVRAAKERYLGGEPVIVTVTLRNNTSHAVSFLMLGPKFEFAVRNNPEQTKGRGRLVRLIGKGRDESTGEKVGEHLVVPRSSWSYPVVLSRLFDMSRAGTYTISSKKSVKLDPNAPGDDLVGPLKVARDFKLIVSEDDLAPAP